MARTVVEIRGTTQAVDTFLGPLARGGSFVTGALMSFVLWWVSWNWWVPIPLATNLILVELWLARRGDRAQVMRIDGGVLRLTDPLSETSPAVDLRTMTNATLFYRMPQVFAGVHTQAIDLAVGDDEGVCFSLRLTVGPGFEPRIQDVPVEPIDLLLGGIAGVFRALAPAVSRPRQAFLDLDRRFLNALIEAVPPDAWARTGLRLWQGMEPELDLFGYYIAGHDGWMVLEGHDWTVEDRAGTVRGWDLSRAERSAILFAGHEDKQTVEKVSLGVINLGVSMDIAVPMPLLSAPEELRPLSGDLHHTHAPEGAALLWHLLLHTSRDRWPTALRDQIEASEEGDLLASMLPGM